jgi:hypothetical protein
MECERWRELGAGGGLTGLEGRSVSVIRKERERAGYSRQHQSSEVRLEKALVVMWSVMAVRASNSSAERIP